MPPLPPNLSKAGLLRSKSGWNNSSLSRRSNTIRGLLSTRTPQSTGNSGGGIPNPSLGIGVISEAMPKGATGSWQPRLISLRRQDRYATTPRKVAAPTPAPESGYQFSVNMVINESGTLAVGAYRSPQSGTGTANESGVVYVYASGDYTTTPTKVAAPTPALESAYQFGYAIAINDSGTLAVGAYGSTQTGTGSANDSGVVYVYASGDYTTTPTKVTAPTPALESGYRFGYAIAINDSGTLAVGAPGSTQTGTGTANDSGVVYVYASGDYTTTPTKVTAPTPALESGYRFGFAIAINESGTLAVNAPGSTQTGTGSANNSGVVYVYASGDYTTTPTKVAAPTPALESGYFFGVGLAINGSGTLAVGAYGSTQTGTGSANDSGVVYVYASGDYTTTPTKVTAPTPALESAYKFGYAIAINDSGTLAVGAYGSTQTGTGSANNSGVVYVYASGDYTTTPTKVAAPTPALESGYFFGVGLAINGSGRLAVNAPGSTQTGTGSADGSGVVYVYE